MGRDGRHRRNSTRPGRWARSLDVDEEAPVAASSTGNSTGTSYQALLLTPGRYVRLFESCGDLKAGVPGIIVPDEVPAVDTGRPPVEGELPSVPVLASRQCHPGEASDSVQLPPPPRTLCGIPADLPSSTTTAPQVILDASEEDVQQDHSSWGSHAPRSRVIGLPPKFKASSGRQRQVVLLSWWRRASLSPRPRWLFCRRAEERPGQW